MAPGRAAGVGRSTRRAGLGDGRVHGRVAELGPVELRPLLVHQHPVPRRGGEPARRAVPRIERDRPEGKPLGLLDVGERLPVLEDHRRVVAVVRPEVRPRVEELLCPPPPRLLARLDLLVVGDELGAGPATPLLLVLLVEALQLRIDRPSASRLALAGAAEDGRPARVRAEGGEVGIRAELRRVPVPGRQRLAQRPEGRVPVAGERLAAGRLVEHLRPPPPVRLGGPPEALAAGAEVLAVVGGAGGALQLPELGPRGRLIGGPDRRGGDGEADGEERSGDRAGRAAHGAISVRPPPCVKARPLPRDALPRRPAARTAPAPRRSYPPPRAPCPPGTASPARSAG